MSCVKLYFFNGLLKVLKVSNPLHFTQSQEKGSEMRESGDLLPSHGSILLLGSLALVLLPLPSAGGRPPLGQSIVVVVVDGYGATLLNHSKTESVFGLTQLQSQVIYNNKTDRISLSRITMQGKVKNKQVIDV